MPGGVLGPCQGTGARDRGRQTWTRSSKCIYRRQTSKQAGLSPWELHLLLLLLLQVGGHMLLLLVLLLLYCCKYR
jgi:hypothetical protein